MTSPIHRAQPPDHRSLCSTGEADLVDADIVSSNAYGEPLVKMASWPDAVLWREFGTPGSRILFLLYTPVGVPFGETMDVAYYSDVDGFSRQVSTGGRLTREAVDRLRWFLLRLGLRTPNSPYPLFFGGGDFDDTRVVLVREPLPRLKPADRVQTPAEARLRELVDQVDRILDHHNRLARELGHEVLSDEENRQDSVDLAQCLDQISDLAVPLDIPHPDKKNWDQKANWLVEFGQYRHRWSPILPEKYKNPESHVGVTVRVRDKPADWVSALQNVYYRVADLWEHLTGEIPMKSGWNGPVKSSALLLTPEELPQWEQSRTLPGRLSVSDQLMEPYELLGLCPYTQPWEECLEWARSLAEGS